MQFLYYALFAAGIVAVDQLSKYFTVAYIPLYTDISFIPGVLNLTYVQNSGAAFSSFEGQQWLFALIFLFFTGLIVWEYFKKKMAFTPCGCVLLMGHLVLFNKAFWKDKKK